MTDYGKQAIKRCCKQMSIIYRAYLWGLGYRRDKSVDWRKPVKA